MMSTPTKRKQNSGENKGEKKAKQAAAEPALQQLDEADTVVCKDCGESFPFPKAERESFEKRGFTPRTRCKACTKARKAQFDGDGAAATASVPRYDDAVEAKLDAWLAAKRTGAFEEADRLRQALRHEGVEPDEARPKGYKAPISQAQLDAKKEREGKKAKCFNCGAKGHLSSACPMAAGSKVCYYCGSADHQGKDCPNAPPAVVGEVVDLKTARCFNCGMIGHLAGTCSLKTKQGADKKACYICGELGHGSRFCPKAKEKIQSVWDGEEVQAKLAEWKAMREAKDYEAADRVRGELMAQGVNPNKPPKAWEWTGGRKPKARRERSEQTEKW